MRDWFGFFFHADGVAIVGLGVAQRRPCGPTTRLSLSKRKKKKKKKKKRNKRRATGCNDGRSPTDAGRPPAVDTKATHTPPPESTRRVDSPVAHREVKHFTDVICFRAAESTRRVDYRVGLNQRSAAESPRRAQVAYRVDYLLADLVTPKISAVIFWLFFFW